MADPSPVVGLPNYEWIELKNISVTPVNLSGWRVADPASQSGPMPTFILKPDSLVIICSSSAAASISAYGTCITVSSFPSLDNGGDLLFLKTPSGKTIHAVSYSDTWYDNELKKEGGWSLEMTDPLNPCTGKTNWKASIDSDGGTPGKKNSIDNINHDTHPPVILRSYTTDSTTIILVFDESLDSISASLAVNYSIDKNLNITTASALAPLFNEVRLRVSSSLAHQIIYTVSIRSVLDCSSNQIAGNSIVVTGLPDEPSKSDMVVNEILFNPKPNGYDFVEIFNNSKKVLDLSKLSIANRAANGQLASIKAMVSYPLYIFPGEYFVITEEPGILFHQYLVKYPDKVLPLSLPSFPDNEGSVIILNSLGMVIDEVSYKDYWHYKLIADPEGVSLERIDPAGYSNNRNNWHSASSTSGYGTPSYQNSQYRQVEEAHSSIELFPKVFSPDNDGFDDILTITYLTESAGYNANISIYNSAGIPVKRLVQNELLGFKGYWNWDGLDDKGCQLPLGQYIIYTEIFNLEGKRKFFKQAIVLARKF